jgi:hypothetical protein
MNTIEKLETGFGGLSIAKLKHKAIWYWREHWYKTHAMNVCCLPEITQLTKMHNFRVAHSVFSCGFFQSLASIPLSWIPRDNFFKYSRRGKAKKIYSREKHCVNIALKAETSLTSCYVPLIFYLGCLTLANVQMLYTCRVITLERKVRKRHYKADVTLENAPSCGL